MLRCCHYYIVGDITLDFRGSITQYYLKTLIYALIIHNMITAAECHVLRCFHVYTRMAYASHIKRHERLRFTWRIVYGGLLSLEYSQHYRLFHYFIRDILRDHFFILEFHFPSSYHYYCFSSFPSYYFSFIRYFIVILHIFSSFRLLHTVFFSRFHSSLIFITLFSLDIIYFILYISFSLFNISFSSSDHSSFSYIIYITIFSSIYNTTLFHYDISFMTLIITIFLHYCHSYYFNYYHATLFSSLEYISSFFLHYYFIFFRYFLSLIHYTYFLHIIQASFISYFIIILRIHYICLIFHLFLSFLLPSFIYYFHFIHISFSLLIFHYMCL